MVISQGDVFWLDPGAPIGSAPGFRHPYVVVQNNLFNGGRLRTTVVCALTSNVARAGAPGNVLLDEGEAGLPRQSVVNVTQLLTVDKSRLVEKLGSLSRRRIHEVLDGIALVLEPRDVDA